MARKREDEPPKVPVPPAAPALPEGVVMVTVTVPVFVGKNDGYDGGTGHVNLRMGRRAAMACQRIVEAHQRMGAAAGLAGMINRSDVVRHVFESVAKATEEMVRYE